MSMKTLFVRLAEKITGRKCCRCQYNRSGTCTHPHEDAFPRCWQSLDRPGFLERVENAPGDLTEQEKHELGKIVESLQEASTTAQEAGLLESPAPAIPRRDAYWDERAESGLLGEE